MAMITRIVRRAYFSAAHRLFNPSLSLEQNHNLFGQQAATHGTGHNYILEAYVEGPIHPESGMIVTVKELDALLQEVVSQLDHRFLNEDVPYFKATLPTVENIARYCYQFLEPMFAARRSLRLARVRLYESDSTWADVGYNLTREL